MQTGEALALDAGYYRECGVALRFSMAPWMLLKHWCAYEAVDVCQA